MLTVTVELVPGGRGKPRLLSQARIGNVGGGELATYVVWLGSELDAGGVRSDLKGVITDYPRWSAEVWDLVARAICVALAGAEKLPKRPSPLSRTVPVLRDGNTSYIRFSDVPAHVRTHFERRMMGRGQPVIEGEGACAYASDWKSFLSGG